MLKNRRWQLYTTKGERTVLIVFGILIAVTIAFMLMLNYYVKTYIDIIQHTIEHWLIAEAQIVGEKLDPEEFPEFVVIEDAQKPRYQELTLQLAAYAEERGLEYVYVMRLLDMPEGKMLQYILDSDLDPETRCELDYREVATEISLQAFGGQIAFNAIGQYDPGWEGLFSAYLPVFDNEGNVFAVIGIDILDVDIVQRLNTSRMLMLLTIASVIFLAGISLTVIILLRKKAIKAIKAEQESAQARDESEKLYEEAELAKGTAERLHQQAEKAKSEAEKSKDEAELARQAADKANKAKSIFLSNMSHEMRTPMNAIIGLTEILKITKDSKQITEFLETISSSSYQLLEIIDNVLDISAIESGKWSLRRKKMSIYTVMNDVENIVAIPAQKAELSLGINVSQDIPQYVYGDATQLKQVVLNLISNAIKFNNKDGKISVSVSVVEIDQEKCVVEFVVEDTGIGISDEQLVNLFEAFEQGDDGTTRKYGGVGVGLYIAKQIVHMMNGEISVASTLGQGSAFAFYVEMAIVAQEDYPSNKSLSITRDGILDCSGMTFLVVEDVKTNQFVAKFNLERFGAIVELADNGEEGLNKFTEDPSKYSIIFMDVKMPVMDGLEATKRIRDSGLKYSKSIPIIALTAQVHPKEIQETLDAGMNAHIGKPFMPEDMLEAIKLCLKT